MTNKMPSLSRRDFIKTGTLAAASTVMFVRADQVSGTAANSKINLGIIGTGGRSGDDGTALLKTGKVQVTALADYFDFQMVEPAKTYGVAAERCFKGLDGYKAIMALKDIDAVLLTAPPYSRPEHFQAAVDAGKHVFAEKPIAVDPWGCRKFQETGKAAAARKLTVGVGLQSRYDPGRRQIAQAIRDGAIGKPVVAHSQRMGGDLWRHPRPANFTERDHQIRHWLYYLWASGDFIVEMHIHNLDVLNWFSGMLPETAYGTGGRTVRTDVGDILDHISVIFQYPGGFHLSHTGTQIPSGYSAQSGQIIGSIGSFDTAKGLITKDKQTIMPGDLGPAADEEMKAFVASVTGQGSYVNDCEHAVTSTFTCILGRTAAYKKEKVSWKDLWASNQRNEMAS